VSRLDPAERRFLRGAVRRRRVFLLLSAAGVAVAAGLAAYYAYRRWLDADFPLGLRAVLVVLILLGARQNLRQYRYASLLEKLDREDEAG
jgi:hypothetical protein